MKRKLKQGFTLIEMLVVISIIAVLTGLILANFNNARLRGRDAARKSDLRQIKSALRLFYNDFQQYPEDGSSDRILGCGNGQLAADLSECDWGTGFVANGNTYMKQLPQDPNPGVNFKYQMTATGDGFILQTLLENASDEDAWKSQVRCDPTVASQADATAKLYMVCED